VCQECKSPLRLIALIKNEDVAKKILTAMHLPAAVPELHPARPPPQEAVGPSASCHGAAATVFLQWQQPLLSVSSSRFHGYLQVSTEGA